MSVAVTADVVHNMDDLDEATECALICTAFYLCVVRLLVYSFHQKDMLYVVNTMRQDWISSSDQDRLIFAEKTMFAFRLAKYFITTVAITIVMFMSVPILEVRKFSKKKKKEKINIRKFEAFNSFSSSSSSSQIYVIGNSDKVLPFRGYFFINQTVSPVFEFLYLFNVTAGGFGGSMIAGATSFNLVVIIHGSGKFAALRKRMEALSGADPNSTSIMGDNVIRHQQAIKSIKKKSGSFALQTMILTWIDAAIRRYLIRFLFLK